MKRAFVKSALVALAIMLISVSAFAADAAASVVMEGSLWSEAGFKLDAKGQKDADLVQFSVSDAQFGASFRLWGTIGDNDNGTGDVSLRQAQLWFKPVDMLKITVGKVDSGLFTEQLNWWMVPLAGSKANWGNWGQRWNSDAAFGGNYGQGIALTLTPVDGLSINAGIAPGVGNYFLVDTDPVAAGNQWGLGGNSQFGFSAKYAIAGFGSVGAAYRNNGGINSAAGSYGDWQNMRVGVDINAVPGLYVILQGIMAIDAGATGLSGVTIDNYIAYSAGAFSVKAEFPFTMRLTGVAGDDSYMTFDLKAAYKVGSASPFLRIRQNGDKDDRGYLDFGTLAANTSLFAPAIDIGADYSFGKCGAMTAIRIVLPAATDGDIVWSIPFQFRVSW